jgi:uncharacterized protein (TIGR03435 family)
MSSEILMRIRIPRRMFAATFGVSLLPLVQVLVTTQVNTVRPAAAEAASVKALDPSTPDHRWEFGEPLISETATMFVDRRDLLQFIGSAYLDADGAGACAMLIAKGHECQLIAGSVPAWVRADKFEITLKWRPESLPVETVDRLKEFRFTNSFRRNVYPSEVQLMLQRVLEETFDLKVRRQQMELPVWAVTRRTQESSLQPAAAAAGQQGRRGLIARKEPPPDNRVALMFEGSRLKDVADFFSFYLDRPVIDRTGIEGYYDVTLKFTGDGTGRLPWKTGGIPIVMAGFNVARLAQAFDGLGFNIESTTAPFEILFIDQVRRPVSSDSSLRNER